MTIVITLAVGLLVGYYLGGLNRTININFGLSDDSVRDGLGITDWSQIDSWPEAVEKPKTKRKVGRSKGSKTTKK